MRRHNVPGRLDASAIGAGTVTPRVPDTQVEPGHMTRQADHERQLRRIDGQVRGINRMVDDEAHCIDIVTQVSSVTKALDVVVLGLLDEHLTHGVAGAAKTDGRAADRKIKEASEAIARLVRS